MATWQPWISFLSSTQGPWLLLWSPPELFLHQMKNKSMTCEVIKRKALLIFPLSASGVTLFLFPLSCVWEGLVCMQLFSWMSYTGGSTVCWRGSVCVLRSLPGVLQGAWSSQARDAALRLLMLLMLVPNYCRKPPLPLCSIKDRSQGHMSNLNVLCPHWFLQETELCLSLKLYFIFQLAFGGTILYQLLDYYCFV